MLRRLGVHASFEAEWGWAAGRFGVVGAALIGAALFLRDTSAFPVVITLLVIASGYGSVLLYLLTRRQLNLVFGLGLALDNGALLIGWWAVTSAQAGSSQTSDIWMVLIPLIIMGVVRLGWVVGSVYTALWVAWMSWSFVHYYAPDSYDIEQLPVRVAFIVVIAGLVMRLVSLLGRQRERELERLLEVERLESLKSTLLRTVAHEVKSPITAVRAAAELLTDESIDVAPEQRRRIAATLSGGVQRLERIVQESLSYAELKAGALGLSLEELDICEAVQDVAGVLAPTIELKQQAFDIVTPERPVLVQVDHARVIQMLSALITVATSRASSGAHLRVSVRQDRLGAIIEVAVPGWSIPEAEREMIFEEFYQGAEPDRASQQTPLLGLAMAKQLAQALGGDIDVRSGEAGPTVFTVTLPEIAASPAR
jgi:signal transduction histidine kinase